MSCSEIRSAGGLIKQKLDGITVAVTGSCRVLS